MSTAQENAPAVGTARGATHGSTDASESEAARLRAKRIATAQARAVLASALLTETTDDAGRPAWLLTQGAETRCFRVLEELEDAVGELRSTWA